MKKQPQDPPQHHAIVLHVRCPGCGQDGWLKVKTIALKTSSSNFMTKKIYLDKYTDLEETIPVTKRQHPYKYMSFFGCTEWMNNDHPIINPPSPRLPKPGEEAYEPYRASLEQLDGLTKDITLFSKMLPLVFKKYPSIAADDDKIAFYFSVVRKSLHSMVDDRWGRSLPEWVMICKTAITEGVNVAAKKHSGVTPEGRQIRLSRKRIKEMIPIATQFARLFPSCFLGFMNSCLTITDAISNDPELSEIYRRFEANYDYDETKRKSEKSNESIGVETADSCNHKVKDKDKKRRYHYFYVRHYDKALYQERKQKGIKNTGRRECGPFKGSDFPNDLIEQLIRTKQAN